MSATIPTVPNGEYEAPFRARIEKPKDFYGPEHPSNIPDEPVGEVLPEVVFTAGGAIAAPKQARQYANGGVLPAGDLGEAPEWLLNRGDHVIPADHPALDAFAPLLDRIGPGAAAMVEREMDRARAFEVIARAAVEYIDVGGSAEADALAEAVAENRGALQ